MKKWRITCIFLLILGFMGCGNSKTKEPIEGYLAYDNDAYGFTLHYPEGWVVLDQHLDMQELESAAADTGMKAARLKQSIYSDTVIFYNAGEGLTSEIFSIVTVKNEAVQADYFKNEQQLKMLSTDLIEQINRIAGDVRILEEPMLATYGQSTFLLNSFSYSTLQHKLYSRQAILPSEGTYYILTYTMMQDRREQDLEEFGLILESFELY